VELGPNVDLRMSDRALVERVVARDESALAAIYDRYSGMLHSMVMRVLRDTQAAEEILQDIFFQLWNNAVKFDPERGSLPGWLLVSARNRAISRLRRFHRVGMEELEENMVVVSFNIESSLSQEQMVRRVKGAIEELSEVQRQAVELAFFEGLTHTEIAERTGEPLGTVKTRLRSAIESLKKTFRP
jgi:RNA polymerase sigma-70 factor (ECF subfamily)